MFIIKLVIVCIKVAWSCAYCASTILIFGKLIYKRNFHQIGCGNVRASMRCTLSVGSFFTLRHFTNEGPAISPSDNVMASILSSILSAWLSLTVATKSRLFKVSSCFPLFQVQALPFFSKPMCHAPVFQKERFLISWLKNCHSSSISIETKSPPWCLQTFLLFC